MKYAILAGAVVALMAGAPAWADTLDPLHIECTGCSDNGTNTPLPTGTSTFSFSSSPPGATGTLYLEVLIPNNVINPVTFTAPSVSGFANGTPSIFNSVTAWTGGTVNAYLGGVFNVNASPDNGIGAYLPATQAIDSGATGFFDFLLNAGTVSGAGLAGPGVTPLVDTFTIGGNLPLGSYVIAMLLSTDSKGNPIVIDTANSGAGFVDAALVAATPLPAALPMFLGGLAGFYGLLRRKRKTGVPI
jgi:hypothetical protein